MHRMSVHPRNSNELDSCYIIFLYHNYFKYLFFYLTELLRVIRRLNLKEQWTDLSLHFITLYSLRSTISENTRAQNHFRSIGGLEVLLDGLGLPSSKFSVSKQSSVPSDERYVFHQWQNQPFDVAGPEVRSIGQ